MSNETYQILQPFPVCGDHTKTNEIMFWGHAIKTPREGLKQ